MRSKSAYKYFGISLEAKRYIQKRSKFAQYHFKNNELRMRDWDGDKTKHLPIEAFFYLHRSTIGKHDAERYQDQFCAHGGGKVPIVSIQLPAATKRFKVRHHRRTPRKCK